MTPIDIAAVTENLGVECMKPAHQKTYLKYRGWMLHVGLCERCRNPKLTPCNSGEMLRLGFYNAEMSMRSFENIERECDAILMKAFGKSEKESVP